MPNKIRPITIIIIVTLAVKAVYLLMFNFYDLNPDLNSFRRGDSYWYERIATNGHEKITPDQLGKCEDGNIEQSYYAFFPLYPAVIGASVRISGLSFNVVAFFYSIILSLALALLFFHFVGKIQQWREHALTATLILILFPFHYYFSMYYTEALFLVLLIGSFFAIHERKPLLMALTSSLMVICRPNGLFLLLPLFLFLMERDSLVKKFRIGALFRKISDPSYLVFIFPVVTFAVYCIYLRYMTGDFFAYKTAQAGWCRQTVLPWVPILRSNSWQDYFKIAWLLLFGLTSLIHVRKIPFSFTVLILISLALPLIADSITLPRFISVVFVFPLIFSNMLSKLSQISRILIFIFLFAAQLCTFHFWIIGSDFSY